MNIGLNKIDNKISQNIQSIQSTNKITSKFANNSKKDEFVSSHFAHNNDNLKFNIKKIKFFKEDEEKMAKMSIEDKINYKIKLKNENRYTIL